MPEQTPFWIALILAFSTVGCIIGILYALHKLAVSIHNTRYNRLIKSGVSPTAFVEEISTEDGTVYYVPWRYDPRLEPWSDTKFDGLHPRPSDGADKRVGRCRTKQEAVDALLADYNRREAKRKAETVVDVQAERVKLDGTTVPMDNETLDGDCPDIQF